MECNKTIKQIAYELRVSKQAVWQRVKRSAELSAMLNEHSKTVNGTVYVDDVLEQHIKEQYHTRNTPETVDEMSVNVDETVVNNSETVYETSSNVDVNKLIITLQNTVDTLKQQLTIKDKQIDELTTMLNSSQERETTLVTALTAAQALHAGTIQERLTDRSASSGEQLAGDVTPDTPLSPEPEQKRGFFSRLFNKKR